MTLDELNKELRTIKHDGATTIDGSSPEQLLGMPPGMAGAATQGVIQAKKTETSSWFHKLIDGLLEAIQKTICCHGYTKIDDANERAELAGKLSKAVIKSIPMQYRLIAQVLLKKLIKKAILKILEYLATLGTKMCDGMACALSPLVIK